ncbi:hypothetical protein CANCADRAFT_23240 [Tortispora caseinolytica NRRL Y-17796]|uniref:Acyl-coenzyme A oxidase n=1 Tax=Tortispora caseinolytica NRRL Y-17796 TaxID=767744 RepID=A0A1E4TM74_9ASCO|nr:hypothetical protein CANCADRAFT_23240 [Tortispora caseinolytica NRRL Y-17796]
MAMERARASFPTRNLTYFIEGSKEKAEYREKLLQMFERDPDFDQRTNYDLTKDQLRERTMRRIAKTVSYIEKNPTIQYVEDIIFAVSKIDYSLTTRIGVHYGLFVNTIMGSGTDKQIDYFLNQRGAVSLDGIIGCFGMTELGHGSNVAGLETTATFDRETDEFIINTPHIGATKWWIGGAAHTCNHCVVFARLIVDGKDYGVKNFVVPLRNSDYSLCTGVALGDIGRKQGRDGIDNGWIQFTNVRIPRNYFLQRYAKIDRNGKVTEPPLAQLAYGALIHGRVTMVSDSAQILKRVSTIAVRYGAVRRQFSSSPHEEETRILDYPLHQRRLFPIVAQTYALQFAADAVANLEHGITTRQATIDLKDMKAVMSMVNDVKALFATSACLKAFSTWAAAQSIDTCRQCCGGHGYSAYSGFGAAMSDWHVMLTWEGDNSVLSISTGRALIGYYTSFIKSGEKALPSGMEYIALTTKPAVKADASADISSPEVIVAAWDAVTSLVVKKAGDAYLAAVKSGKSKLQALESVSQHRFLAAKAHATRFIVNAFYQRLQSAPADIKPVLERLFRLYGLFQLEQDNGLLIQTGFFNSEQIDKVRDAVDAVCAEIRPDAIALTDAFNFSDYVINSSLGGREGRVYEDYFTKVKTQNPPENIRAPYHDQYIGPVVNRNLGKKPFVPLTSI